MLRGEWNIQPHPMKFDGDDIRSLFKELDALRRAASEAATAKHSRWTTRVATLLARVAITARRKARRFVRVASLVAVALLIHVLALALADRAYAPYSVGADIVVAGPR